MLRADLDVELAYRFIRDTVWVAVRWYRPGGTARPTRSPSSTCTILLKGSTTRPMAEAYIVDAVRTPVGKRGGALAGVHSADLGAHVARARWSTAPASTRPRSTT